jgi:hypothetical protein
VNAEDAGVVDRFSVARGFGASVTPDAEGAGAAEVWEVVVSDMPSLSLRRLDEGSTGSLVEGRHPVVAERHAV